MKRSLLATALLAIVPALVLADEPERAFTGEVDAAWMKSTGSSNKETLKGRVDTQYKTGRWAHQFKAEGLNETDNDTGIRSIERYLVMEKSSWSFTERDYIFVKPQWEKDVKSGFEYQAFLAVGYGREFLKSDSLFLSMDFGAGSRYSKQDTGLGGKTDSEGMGNVALKFEWKFLPNARFNEDASVETGKDSTVYRTRSAVTVNVTDVVGLNFAYETKRDTGPSNTEDTLTTFGLNYRFK